MISPSQRPLPDNTQHSQQTNLHAPGGIRTHNRSRRAAVDLRLRPRGYWDRLHKELVYPKFFAVQSLICITSICLAVSNTCYQSLSYAASYALCLCRIQPHVFSLYLITPEVQSSVPPSPGPSCFLKFGPSKKFVFPGKTSCLCTAKVIAFPPTSISVSRRFPALSFSGEKFVHTGSRHVGRKREINYTFSSIATSSRLSLLGVLFCRWPYLYLDQV